MFEHRFTFHGVFFSLFLPFFPFQWSSWTWPFASSVSFLVLLMALRRSDARWQMPTRQQQHIEIVKSNQLNGHSIACIDWAMFVFVVHVFCIFMCHMRNLSSNRQAIDTRCHSGKWVFSEENLQAKNLTRNVHVFTWDMDKWVRIRRQTGVYFPNDRSQYHIKPTAFCMSNIQFVINTQHMIWTFSGWL